MKLSAALSLAALLSTHHLSCADRAARKRRMLARNQRRALTRGGPGVAAGRAGGDGDDVDRGPEHAGQIGGGGKEGSDPGLDRVVGGGRNPLARGNVAPAHKRKPSLGSNTATNKNGILLDRDDDEVTYGYGDTISVKFDLTIANIFDRDLAETLDESKVGSWKMGIFMRMSRPQGGVLAPIENTVVRPDIAGASRTLLEVAEVQEEARMEGSLGLEQPFGEFEDLVESDQSVEDFTQTEPDADGSFSTNAVITPLVLPKSGTATFSSDMTSADTLDPIEKGTGFDIWLLDENGSEVAGPCTFYILPDEDAGGEESDHGRMTVLSGGGETHPLLQYEEMRNSAPGPSKPAPGLGAFGAFSALGAGDEGGCADEFGCNTGSDGGMIIATSEGLPTYYLATDKEYYAAGEDVMVTYDLNPDALARGPAGVQRRRRLDGEVETGPSVPTSTDEEMPPLSQTEEPPPMPPMTTEDSTSSLDDTDQDGIPYDDEGDLTGEEREEDDPAYIARDDVTKFKAGIFMRMANPQMGRLTPILEMPLCADPCTMEPDAIKVGLRNLTFEEALDAGGYDVWILNGRGEELAGPVTFYVE